MATRSLSLLNGALLRNPKAQWNHYTSYNPAAVRNSGVWVFDAAETGTVYLNFRVPADYVSGGSLVLHWTSGVVMGNASFSVSHRTATPGATVMGADTSPASRTNTLTTSAKPAAANRLEEDTITLTATDFAPGRLVVMDISRMSVSDTKSDDVVLFGAFFEYQDA